AAAAPRASRTGLETTVETTAAAGQDVIEVLPAVVRGSTPLAQADRAGVTVPGVMHDAVATAPMPTAPAPRGEATALVTAASRDTAVDTGVPAGATTAAPAGPAGVTAMRVAGTA